MRYILFILISTFCSCSDTNKKKETTIHIENKFIEEDVKWFQNNGSSSIKGIAKFKSKNEHTRFGKNFRVELNPYTPYTQERLTHIYKNNDSGFVYIESGIPKFIPDPTGYHNTRKVMCNAKGEFKFENLPAGDYYIIAFMLWDKTGGGIMQHLKLSDNEVKFVKMMNF